MSVLLACALVVAGSGDISPSSDVPAVHRSPSEIMAALEPSLAVRMQDADCLRMLGTAYAQSGRYEEAITLLRRAQSISPSDRDIAAALARALAWSGNKAGARIIVDDIASMDPSNSELPALRQMLLTDRQIGLNMTVSGSAGVSAVEVGGRRQTWREVSVAATVVTPGGLVIGGGAERFIRNSGKDTRLSVSAGAQLATRLSASLELSGTAHPSFREKFGMAAGLNFSVQKSFDLFVDVRRYSYAAGRSLSVQPGMRWSLPNNRASFTARSLLLSATSEPVRMGFAGRMEVALGSASALYAGAATYPDTEAGITRRMRSVYVGGVLPLTSTISVRLTLDHDRRQASYSRTGLNLGLSVRLP